jgi:hypothetical protein
MPPPQRQILVILFVGNVVFAPTFELFEEGRDMEEGTDFVQLVLSALTWCAFAVLWSKVAALLFHWLRFFTIPPDPFRALRDRSRSVQVEPPESLLVTLCTFRI